MEEHERPLLDTLMLGDRAQQSWLYTGNAMVDDLHAAQDEWPAERHRHAGSHLLRWFCHRAAMHHGLGPQLFDEESARLIETRDCVFTSYHRVSLVDANRTAKPRRCQTSLQRSSPTLANGIELTQNDIAIPGQLSLSSDGSNHLPIRFISSRRNGGRTSCTRFCNCRQNMPVSLRTVSEPVPRVAPLLPADPPR